MGWRGCRTIANHRQGMGVRPAAAHHHGARGRLLASRGRASGARSSECVSGDCRCCRVGEQGSRLTMWVEPRSTWRMCAEGRLGGEAEWVARGGVEVLRSVIMYM